ncbi:MAG TPA: hypothetical protein VFM88_08845 [Vicinamibacteria bacterium]|nr:hypothetical protein [Vicinamibacteria bacterium]
MSAHAGPCALRRAVPLLWPGILALAVTLRAQQAPDPPPPAAQPTPPPAAYGLLLRGEEAEAFLRTADVVKKKPIGKGITNPYQLTLSDGTRTLKAAWKTIDKSKFGVTQFDRGGFEVNFRDTYKFEIAAYELDKILGFELVPPTVERQIGSEKGSVQLWVEGATTEWDRRKKKVRPPDTEAWNRQIYNVRLIHQLTYNTDYTNISNTLSDPSFKVYAIDFSRAFRTYDTLLAEKELVRFSRFALDRLKALDRETLAERLGPWLTKVEIEGLLKRRDRILALAARLVAEKGEAEVLLP